MSPCHLAILQKPVHTTAWQMERLTVCLRWLLAVGLVAMITLGLSTLRHLVSPHFTSLNRRLRVAYLGLLLAGEGILLHHLFMLLTGRPYAMLEHFLGRVLGVFLPLLMVCACAESSCFTFRSLQTTGGVSGTKGTSSCLTFAARDASHDRGTHTNGNKYQISSGLGGASRSQRQRQDAVGNSKGRCGKTKRPLPPFLVSYLWTLGIAVSGMFYFYPNAYPCFIDGAYLDCRMTSRIHLERSDARDPEMTMDYDDGSATEGVQRVPGVTEGLVALNASAFEITGQGLSLPQGGDKETASFLEYEDFLTRGRGEQLRETRGHNTLLGPGVEATLTPGRDPSLASDTDPSLVSNMEPSLLLVSVKTCRATRSQWFCVKDVCLEMIFYVFYVLPLALSWLLVTWDVPKKSVVSRETDLPDSFLLVRKGKTTVDKPQLPELTLVLYSKELFEKNEPRLLYEHSNEKDDKTSLGKVEPWASEHVCDNCPMEKLCDFQKLFSDACGHCNYSPCTCVAGPEPARLCSCKNSPSHSEKGQVSIACLPEAVSTSEPLTGAGTRVDRQKDGCLCPACDSLRDCLLFVCTVLIVEALVCPLLWGAFAWIRGGPLLLPPFDLLLLPAYSALCFVYRSTTAVSQ